MRKRAIDRAAYGLRLIARGISVCLLMVWNMIAMEMKTWRKLRSEMVWGVWACMAVFRFEAVLQVIRWCRFGTWLFIELEWKLFVVCSSIKALVSFQCDFQARCSLSSSFLTIQSWPVVLCGRGAKSVWVCVEHLNRCKTSTSLRGVFFRCEWTSFSNSYLLFDQQGDHPCTVSDGPTKRLQYMRISRLIIADHDVLFLQWRGAKRRTPTWIYLLFPFVMAKG